MNELSLKVGIRRCIGSTSVGENNRVVSRRLDRQDSKEAITEGCRGRYRGLARRHCVLRVVNWYVITRVKKFEALNSSSEPKGETGEADR